MNSLKTIVFYICRFAYTEQSCRLLTFKLFGLDWCKTCLDHREMLKNSSKKCTRHNMLTHFKQFIDTKTINSASPFNVFEQSVVA